MVIEANQFHSYKEVNNSFYKAKTLLFCPYFKKKLVFVEKKK